MTTILQRLTDSIGLSEDRARQHLAGGYVRDGHVITDPGTDVDDDHPVRFQPEPATEHS